MSEDAIAHPTNNSSENNWVDNLYLSESDLGGASSPDQALDVTTSPKIVSVTQNQQSIGDSDVYVDLSRVRTDLVDNLPEDQIGFFCDAIRPAFGEENMNEALEKVGVKHDTTRNVASTVLSLPGQALVAIGNGWNRLFGALGKVDETINEPIFDAMGLNDSDSQNQQDGSTSTATPKENGGTKEFLAKWTIRGAEMLGLSGVVSYVSNRTKTFKEVVEDRVKHRDYGIDREIQKLKAQGVANAEIERQSNALKVQRQQQFRLTIGGQYSKKWRWGDDVIQSLKAGKLPTQAGQLTLPSSSLQAQMLAQIPVKEFPLYNRLRMTAGSVRNFWIEKSGWAPAATVLLSSSGLIEQISKGVDLVDPEYNWDHDVRKWTERGFNLGAIAASTYLFGGAYGKVKLPYELSKRPAHAVDTHPAVSYLFAGGYLGLGYYFDNVGAQGRAISALEGKNPDRAYLFDWDWDRAQIHTTTSRAINMAVSGPVWAALTPIEMKISDKLERFTKVSSKVLELSPQELARIDAAKGGFAKGFQNAKFVFTSLDPVMARKRKIYFATQFVVASTFGIGLNMASYRAQGYTDDESQIGPNIRSYATIPSQLLFQSAALGRKGFATNIDGYWPGMYLINNQVEGCAKTGEAIYQANLGMEREYLNAPDAEAKAALAAEMVNNYIIAWGDRNNPDSEKSKIAKGLIRLGIDPEYVISLADQMD